MNTSLSLAVSGAVIGFATGVLLQRSRLCLVAMVSNFVLVRDPGQLRAFLAAWAVAIIGTQALDWGGWVAIGESSYRGAQLDWLGATAGGLAFGFGAALAGGCAARTLAQAAEGNGGSLIALVAFAAMAALTQFGVLASYRMNLSGHSALRLASDDNSLAALTGVPALWLGAALALLCLMVALGIRREDRNWRLMLAGALAGALVVAGWWATGWLSRDEFSVGRPESLTFSGPLARIGHALMTGETTGAIFVQTVDNTILFLRRPIPEKQIHWTILLDGQWKTA